MNICIITSSFPLNKNEIYHHYVGELLNILHENGHDVTILTQNKPGEKEKFIPHADVIWFPWKMSAQPVLAQVSLLNIKNIISVFSLFYNGTKYANKIAREKKIDIFICLWIVPSGLFVFLKNLFSKKTPYILWALGSDVLKYKNNILIKFLLRLIINRSKAVFADGFEICRLVKEISQRDCVLLPTFHSIKLNHQQLTRINTVNRNTKQVSLLYVGRITYMKGIDILIESLNLLKKEKQNFRCTIIGDGDAMTKTADLINQYNLQEAVFLPGKIMDENKFAEYFLEADCVVIPSRAESIPIVLCEAIQFDKPVIVTNAGDMEFVVNKYNLGLVAENENPVDLAEKIKQFMKNPIAIHPEDRKNVLNDLLFENNSDRLLNQL